MTGIDCVTDGFIVVEFQVLLSVATVMSILIIGYRRLIIIISDVDDLIVYM